jgi:hypothetical protein
MNLTALRPRAPFTADTSGLPPAPAKPDIRALAAEPSSVPVEQAANYAPPPLMSMDKLLLQRERVQLKLRPVFASHELSLDALHGEAVRLIHQHQHDPAADTLDRLRECVSGIEARVSVKF